MSRPWDTSAPDEPEKVAMALAAIWPAVLAYRLLHPKKKSHPPPASNTMFGLITRKDLLIHPVTVCRHYGWRVLVVGILRPRRTFLDLVSRYFAR